MLQKEKEFPLIEEWLIEIERLPKFSRPQTPRYSIVFGRTTHSRHEKKRSRALNLNKHRSPQLATLQRSHRKTIYMNNNNDDDSSSQQNQVSSTQEDKVKGRQIMTTKQDFTKASEKRKRQMSYALQLKISRKNQISLQIHTITRIVVQSFRRLIDCERCALFLMDHKRDELYFKPVGDALTADVKEIRFPASAGVAGWVATKQQPLNIKNAYHDSRFNSEIDKQTHFRTRTILCAPVISSCGKLFGVIQMVNKKKGDKRQIQKRAKKKKTDGEHHGYESCYEAFSNEDEQIINRCCNEVSKALEPILLPSKEMKQTSGDDNGNARLRNRRRSSTGVDMIDGKGLTTASTRRRSSVGAGNLAQFVKDKEQKGIFGDKEQKGIFGDKISSVSEACLTFQFRSEIIRGGPQISSRGQLKDDPEHLLAVSRRKRMVDYSNNQRKTLLLVEK